MHMMMRVEPAKPPSLLEAPPRGNVHAVVQILIKRIINRHGRARTGEYGRAYKVLYKEYCRKVKSDDQRCVPPSEANLFEIFLIRKKVIATCAEETMVNQCVGTKWILPARLMHEILV